MKRKKKSVLAKEKSTTNIPWCQGKAVVQFPGQNVRKSPELEQRGFDLFLLLLTLSIVNTYLIFK